MLNVRRCAGIAELSSNEECGSEVFVRRSSQRRVYGASSRIVVMRSRLILQDDV